MWPGAAVSGLYFAHPESHYFGVGKVERDQVEDYARAQGLDRRGGGALARAGAQLRSQARPQRGGLSRCALCAVHRAPRHRLASIGSLGRSEGFGGVNAARRDGAALTVGTSRRGLVDGAPCSCNSCCLEFGATITTGKATARELRLSHQMPQDDVRHKASRVLAAELRKRAPGLTITIHPSSSLGRRSGEAVRGPRRWDDRVGRLSDGLCVGKVPGVVRGDDAWRARERGGGNPAQGLGIRDQAAGALRGEGLPHSYVVVARWRNGERRSGYQRGPTASRG